MSPSEKRAATIARKRQERLEEIERQMTEVNDAYLTAKLHGDPATGFFHRLRELGQERRRLRYAS